jgi:DNA-binding FadR family transcriptional regulator
MQMQPTPIRARSLVDRVVQIIGQEIVSGRFPPGASLPYEAEWCERLGVSRSVVREARRVLVSKNLIDIKARAGGRVRAMAAWHLLDPDILAWRAQGQDRETFSAELFELRRVIEPAASALAAQRIAPAELEELRRAYAEMEAAGEDTEQFLAPDIRFHHIIAGAVGNSLFRAIGDVTTVALDIALRMALDAPRGQQQSLPLHKQVLDSIARRDAPGAAEAMRMLVNDAERDVREALAARARKPRRRASRAPGERRSTWKAGL